MATQQDVRAWRGLNLVDRDGDKIGKIEDVYLDRSSGEPEWVAVKTGLFGTNVSFVPIGDASPAGEAPWIGTKLTFDPNRPVLTATHSGSPLLRSR